MVLGVGKCFFVCSSASSKPIVVFPSEVRVHISRGFCALSISEGGEGALPEPPWSPDFLVSSRHENSLEALSSTCSFPSSSQLVIGWLNAFAFRSNNNPVGLC